MGYSLSYPFLANSGAEGREMTDRQRRWWFAQSRGGGGGGGGGSSGGSSSPGNKSLLDGLKDALSNIGKLPEPRSYLDNLSEEGKAREEFFRAAASFTAAGVGVAVDDLLKSKSGGEAALASLGLLFPFGGGAKQATKKVSAEVADALKRLGNAKTQTQMFDVLGTISDEAIEGLQKAYGNKTPAGDWLTVAPLAREMLKDFTATPRQILARQYPSKEAFERAVKDAREFRKANPQFQYLESISDAALDRRIPVKWASGLWDDGAHAQYHVGRNMGDSQVEMGRHLAFEAVALDDKTKLIRAAAHEFRHGLQDHTPALKQSIDRYAHMDYKKQPWEIEVRAAEVRPFIARETGHTLKSTRDMGFAYGMADKLPADVSEAVKTGGWWPKLAGLLGVSALAYPSTRSLMDDRSIRNREKREMTDDQRRWWFAQMGRGSGGGGGGGGGSGGSGSTSGQGGGAGSSKPPPKQGSLAWELTKAAASGFWEGLVGGATVLADKFTFGAIDSLSKAADSYKGWEYDVARKSATVARESLLAAAGIGLASKVGAAWRGTALAATQAGKHAGAITAVAGFGTKSAIDDIRAANPTMNPYADKALAMGSTLAGYVGSMGALKGMTQYGGAAMNKIPLPFAGKSLGEAGKGLLKSIDTGLGKFGASISSKLNPTAAAGLKKAHSAYAKFSDFTGSTIKDLINTPKAMSRLGKANKLAGEAASRRGQADAIKTAAKLKEHQLKQDATRAMSAAHQASKAGSPNAKQMYQDAVDKFWKVDDAARVSRSAAKKLTDSADRLSKKATQLSADAMTSLKKAGYVAGGLAGITARDEYVIGKFKEKQTEALKQGVSLEIPTYKPRSVLGTLGAAIAGTTGNPVEKLFRPGLERKLAETGVHRANYEAIEKARASGEMTRAEADDALKSLAQNKPKNMADNTLWQFAPAAAALLNWKIGDAISEAKRSTVSKVRDVRDGDTIVTSHLFKGQPESKRGEIRMLDLNTPETIHPTKPIEMFGPEASARMKELIKPGQYVRVVQDSNKKASGIDIYDRQLGYVETLPKPFDNLLRIPYLGKAIPAIDINKKMIREGYGDIDYRELSGRTDRAETYDSVRIAAQNAGRNIWSPEGRAALPWVGTEMTIDQRRQDYYQRRTGDPLPDATLSPFMTAAGLGLLTTGNSGIFQKMPISGSALVQLYNATLAVGGALEYNQRATRTLPYETKRPGNILSDYQRDMQRMLW